MERGFITTHGYRAAKNRPACARWLRDELLISELVRVHEENYSVYGVPELQDAMRKAEWEVGQNQVSRLMRKAASRGDLWSQTTTTTPATEAAGGTAA